MNDVAHNKRVATALIRSMGQGLDLSLLAHEFEWWASTRGPMNRAQFTEHAAAFAQRVKSPMTMTITAVTAEEDRVAVEASGHAVMLDGRVYENTYHFLMYLKDGKVVKVRGHNDTAHVAAILGVKRDVPPSAS